MVVHRTIHHLKTRPHHERRAVALLIALGVIIVLFFAWAFVFFSDIHSSSLTAAQAHAAALETAMQQDQATAQEDEATAQQDQAAAQQGQTAVQEQQAAAAATPSSGTVYLNTLGQ
jgi:peptidoglycan hydrolase CwlO-like protein